MNFFYESSFLNRLNYVFNSKKLKLDFKKIISTFLTTRTFMNIFSDNSFTIGNTPLVKINNLTNHPNLYAKIESRNPSFSVKCRIAANIIWQAEKDGSLTKGKKIVEATSGNTGIALSFVAASRGYDITLTMPESMSLERRHMLKALGANLHLTPASEGMKGAVDAAEELAKTGEYFVARQFENPANPAIHEQTTGPEIWRDTDGEIDLLVAGVGTGGTISGTARFLKSKKSVKTLAVEPAESPIITQTLKGEKLVPGAHKIQGIGANFIPKNLDLDLIDDVAPIDSQLALNTAKDILKKEGILVGISSGAAMAAALQAAKNEAFVDKTIVVILPDLTERYLSSPMFN